MDGDDLFEGNYTLGTKNINADHVEGISAVENYTHNPLLRGVEITDTKLLIQKNLHKSLSHMNTYHSGIFKRLHYSIRTVKKLKK